MITYINPAIAVSLGVAVLGEKVSPIMLAAFATILAGSVLATRPARRPAADTQVEADPTPRPEPASRRSPKRAPSMLAQLAEEHS